MHNNQIHPTAYVEDGATLGKNVTIEPFAVVKKNVILHDNVIIKSFAYIDGYTEVGEGTVIYPSASIGTKTQDKKYRGEKTYVKIGKRCEIREFVTVNSSCGEESQVVIGDDVLIMAYSHVAHDCVIGNKVILTNNASLAGHVTIEENAIIGGMTGIHQHVRIGRHAMIGGMSRITHDIPPYLIGAGIPFKFGGINLVGLKRHNFPIETRQLLSDAFHLLYRSDMKFQEALEYIKNNMEQTPEIVHFYTFCKETSRGLMNDQTKSESESLGAPLAGAGKA
ncbi:MAG: acyl-ACP--UDP-N-acetylglucosamine O-acyltransferase [Parachlamydiales bacterium]|jgi:UDP-N-acetylglucosamine acyltransferase